jgi:hypothetical protein
MIVPTILAKMAVLALTKSTHTNVSVEFRSREEIASRKWIRVHQINVATELAAHPARTIKTSTVHARLDTQGDCATKTSTSANFRHRLAEMVPHARTPTDLINASVPKDMKEETAQSTLMTALPSRAKTVERVSMASEITLVCATMVSKENTVKLTSTNACLNPVKTALLVTST